jgi:hypothetical protein
MRNKKAFQTFLLWWKVALSCTLFILSMGKTIRAKQSRFVCIIFVELFTAHLLKKESRFDYFFEPRYMRNKKCCKHFWKPGSITTQTFTFNHQEKLLEHVSRDFLCKDCVELSSAHLSRKRPGCYHFLKSRYMQNRKVFQTVLLCWEVALPSRLFILSMEKPSQKANRKFFIQFL